MKENLNAKIETIFPNPSSHVFLVVVIFLFLTAWSQVIFFPRDGIGIKNILSRGILYVLQWRIYNRATAPFCSRKIDLESHIFFTLPMRHSGWMPTSLRLFSSFFKDFLCEHPSFPVAFPLSLWCIHILLLLWQVFCWSMNIIYLNEYPIINPIVLKHFGNLSLKIWLLGAKLKLRFIIFRSNVSECKRRVSGNNKSYTVMCANRFLSLGGPQATRAFIIMFLHWLLTSATWNGLSSYCFGKFLKCSK